MSFFLNIFYQMTVWRKLSLHFHWQLQLFIILSVIIKVSVVSNQYSHYSEGGFAEFCCTRPGTKPPFAIGYIYMSWVLCQFFPVQYLGQQGFWDHFVPSPSQIAIIQPLLSHTPLLYSIYIGYIGPLPKSKNNPLVHRVELENFNMCFLGPNQVVLAWNKFVPRGVQLTQKLEPLWLAV